MITNIGSTAIPFSQHFLNTKKQWMISLERNLGSIIILCQILWWTPKDQVWELGKTRDADSLFPFSPSVPAVHPLPANPCPLFPPGTDTWLKGTVLQVSWCTSWLFMGKMTPWEAGLILNIKWCQNFLASSWRGDFFICIRSFDWVRAWVPSGKCSLTGSWVGCSSLSDFFQNLLNLNSIFSLCLWPCPAALAPIRCGTATNRSGFSSASSWLPMGSSLRFLSRSTRETEFWLWRPSRGQAALPRGRSTSSQSKRRCMLSGSQASFRFTDGEA